MAHETEPGLDADERADEAAEGAGLPFEHRHAGGAVPAPAPGRKGFRAALDSVLPRSEFADQRDILGGAGQNVIGLVAGVLATFATQIVMTRTLGASLFGVVVVATQFAFIASAATRFGMDVANVRLVAILVGRGEHGRVRALVRKSAVIATVVSAAFALLTFAFSSFLGRSLTSRPVQGKEAFWAAAFTIPFAAVTWAYLGGTRGLKIMRHTLYIFWIGQPVGWIAFAIAGWFVAKNAGITTLAYGLSWAVACALALWAWERETRRFDARTEGGGIPEERLGALLKFGAFRAPATLFAQLLFWTDLFVLARFVPSDIVGVYGAAVRTAQSLLLFLTSLSLVFSPFVADLHARGERDKLDALYKNVTRWGLAATLPVLLALAILPAPILRVFGEDFTKGDSALVILILGMIVPVSVGTVGFILIMVGRTGWDLLVYAGSFVIDIGIAFALARPSVLGMRGAAIAQAVTLTSSAVARLLLVKRFVGIWPFDRWFLRLAPPAVAGGLAMWGAHALLSGPKWLIDLGGSAIAGVVVYAVVLVAFGLRPGERRTILSLASRLRGRAA
ncbi:MAG TPA: MATE family efflux transporter [Actinomycetota bacterium]